MIKDQSNKIVLVTQKTRLEELIYRYNTYGQAKFCIEHNGADFSDYENEHNLYRKAVEITASGLQGCGRVQILDREHIPNYIFGEKDIVVALGRDGLVANVLKYLQSGQKLIGVNPDKNRWDGCLLPFEPGDVETIVTETIDGIRKVQTVTLAKVSLNDGQILYGVNDLFIGRSTHASARYSISQGVKAEQQSSSGIIVSTGLGATGWLKSVLAGVKGISRFYGNKNEINIPADFDRGAPELYYTVREPYPSNSTNADMVFGKIDSRSPLQIVSCMPENGVIFSDGMEQDYLQFNSGMVATVTVADRQGFLVV